MVLINSKSLVTYTNESTQSMGGPFTWRNNARVQYVPTTKCVPLQIVAHKAQCGDNNNKNMILASYTFGISEYLFAVQFQ